MPEVIDIGIEKLMQTLRERGLPDGLSLDERRARMEDIGTRFPAPQSASINPVKIAERPAEWVCDPDTDDGRVMLYVHGGGYVQGSLASHRNLVFEIARSMKGKVLNLDYRLAPEHPFPAAVEDTVNAWAELLEMGIDPKKASFGGDSAGGGLVIAALVSARDKGLPMPSCACCISPWTDLVGSGRTMDTKALEDPMVNRAALEFFSDFYADKEDKSHPLISPLFANLAGLPPLLIQVGTAETLLDDSRRLATRARYAGVDVSYAEWEGMPHIWHIFAPLLEKSRKAIIELGEFVERKTG
ncbi:MAG: alpha/beta hydrolase [Alphaproteobacteria bacterium]